MEQQEAVQVDRRLWAASLCLHSQLGNLIHLNTVSVYVCVCDQTECYSILLYSNLSKQEEQRLVKPELEQCIQVDLLCLCSSAASVCFLSAPLCFIMNSRLKA